MARTIAHMAHPPAARSRVDATGPLERSSGANGAAMRAPACGIGGEQAGGVLVVATATLMALVSVAAALMVTHGWVVGVTAALCTAPHLWVRRQRSRGIPVSHGLIAASATAGVVAATAVVAVAGPAPVALAAGVLVAAGITITLTDLRGWVIAKETCWWAGGVGVASAVLALMTASSVLVWTPDVLAGVVIVGVNAVLVVAAGVSWLVGSGGFGDVRWVVAGWLLTSWWVDPGMWGYSCVAGVVVAGIVWLVRRRTSVLTVDGTAPRSGVLPAGGVYAVMYLALAGASLLTVLA